MERCLLPFQGSARHRDGVPRLGPRAVVAISRVGVRHLLGLTAFLLAIELVSREEEEEVE